MGQRSCLAFARAKNMRVDPSEFRTDQKNLRGVIHPDQHDHDRTCRAKTRHHAATADVIPDQKFADGKQKRSDRRAYPYIAPGDFDARHNFINHRERQHRDAKTEQGINNLSDGFPAGKKRRPPATERGQDRPHHQRHHQQEPDRKYHPKKRADAYAAVPTAR